MNCDTCLTHIPDVLGEGLTLESNREIMAHLMTCATCGPEFERVSQVWQDLGSLPEPAPSPEMSKQFYAMLDGYREGHQTSTAPAVKPIASPKQTNQRIWQFLAAAALVMMGFYVGRTPKTIDPMLDQPATPTGSLAWIKAPSAFTRLESITQFTRGEKELSPHLYSVMLFILERDSSVEVRLAALRALSPYSHQPQVRQGFVEALLRQDSPLIQLEMIDVLCSNNQFDSTETLENLLQRDPLNPLVKQRAQELLLERR